MGVLLKNYRIVRRIWRYGGSNIERKFRDDIDRFKRKLEMILSLIIRRERKQQLS